MVRSCQRRSVGRFDGRRVTSFVKDAEARKTWKPVEGRLTLFKTLFWQVLYGSPSWFPICHGPVGSKKRRISTKILTRFFDVYSLDFRQRPFKKKGTTRGL